jgi:peptidyl-dipeptidase A
MDLQNDLRSLMSVEPNSEWFETVHHELGHIYYYVSYTNDGVPPILREGANRGFHEAVGSMIGMAAMQKPFLQAKGLLPANLQTDDTQKLLQEALNFVVFIPFATGTMTGFEHDLYATCRPTSSTSVGGSWPNSTRVLCPLPSGARNTAMPLPRPILTTMQPSTTIMHFPT